MIQATDLRIQNLVQSNVNIRQNTVGEPIFYIISEIKTFKAHVTRIHNGAHTMHSTHLQYSKIIPIPLTEKWLVWFGFENDSKESAEWTNQSEVFEKKNNEFYYSAGEGVKLSQNIIFVHQLQNLFFALSGKELTLGI